MTGKAGDGTIIFSPAPQSAIYRVPAAGGEATAVTKLDTARQETSHRFLEIIELRIPFVEIDGVKYFRIKRCE